MSKKGKNVKRRCYACPECDSVFARTTGSIDKHTNCPRCGHRFLRRDGLTNRWDEAKRGNSPNKGGKKTRGRAKKDLQKFLPPEFASADEGMLADRQAVQYKMTGKRNGGVGKFKRKADDGFYRSMKWRQVRYLALKNTEGQCQCCGATAADGLQIHVDHIEPRSKRPDLSLSLDNLQVLCSDCNIGKGSWDESNWREHWRSI